MHHPSIFQFANLLYLLLMIIHIRQYYNQNHSSIRPHIMSTSKFHRTSKPTAHEQFVTLQFKNNNNKKKNQHHRLSIFNQLKFTQTLVEESLNKITKSMYKKQAKKQKRTVLWDGEARKENKPKVKNYMSKEIRMKLQQISIISKFFKKACQKNKKPSHFFTPDSQKQNHTLLYITQQIELPALSKQKEEENNTILTDWKQQVKSSNQYIFNKRIQIKKANKYTIKQCKTYNRDQNGINFTEQPTIEYSQTYFTKINHDRLNISSLRRKKSAMGLLFCNNRQKAEQSETIDINNSLYKYNQMKLQEFIQGGYKQQLNQHSDYLKLSTITSSRQQFKTFDKIYQHVKQNINLDCKNMDEYKDKQMSIESVVFYMQNQLNLTQVEKKQIKAKLKMVD